MFAAVVLPLAIAACSQSTDMDGGMNSMAMPARHYGYSAADRECLMRAMFFEADRSSRDGLVAVGTVVMNRLRSGEWGDTICQVVGAPGQFAPGVLTREMNSQELPDVAEAADAVLKGERHSKVKNAMFFHTAGLKFPYRNMHYTLVAGGNAFYEKRNRQGDPVVLPPEKPRFEPAVMVAEADVGQKGDRLAGTRGPLPASDAAAAAAAAKAGTQIAAADNVAAPIPAAISAPKVEQGPEEQQPVTVMAIDGPTPSTGISSSPFDAVAGIVLPETTNAIPFPSASRPAHVEPLPAASGEMLVAAATTGLRGGIQAAAPAETPVGQALAPEPASMAAFEVDAEDASAIGALLLAQERTALGFE
ncbi:cell wall hydrolase [Pseudaminobacter sp. 19-2017]|uniref:Cell wall hydrolase n=2 Tax=Pseudaminobacter soli (ex Zhang et al. 2022) TaxID=2831468 RepID=A0A942DXC3_9HYPH|nr:cell wall hydrolase [Pseudaminobacter soli]